MARPLLQWLSWFPDLNPLSISLLVLIGIVLGAIAGTSGIYGETEQYSSGSGIQAACKSIDVGGMNTETREEIAGRIPSAASSLTSSQWDDPAQQDAHLWKESGAERSTALGYTPRRAYCLLVPDCGGARYRLKTIVNQ